jgi:alpha-1,2-mannosyltransferase
VAEQRTANNRQSFGLAAAVLGVGALYWLRWSGVNSGNWVDLEVYVRGAQAMATRTPLYAPHPGVLPFTYSPFAAVAFTPLLIMGTVGARWVLSLGSLASYLIVIGTLGWRLHLPRTHLVLVGLAGMALEPFVRTMLLGQVNLYLMAAVVVDALVIKSSHRGWLVGLAAGIKLVPGVFVLYFALKRDWHSCLRVGAGFLLTVVFGVIVAPQDSLGYWSGGLLGISHWGPVAVVDGKNQSLIGQLARVSHNPSPVVATVLALCAGGLALGIAAAHRQSHKGDDVAALTAIAIGGLLACPLSWTHHWVWGLPAIMVLVSRRQWVATCLAGSVLAAGAARGPTLQPSEASLTFLQQLACSTYVAAGVALLVIWVFDSGGVARSAPTTAPRTSRRQASSLGLVQTVHDRTD